MIKKSPKGKVCVNLIKTFTYPISSLDANNIYNHAAIVAQDEFQREISGMVLNNEGINLNTFVTEVNDVSDIEFKKSMFQENDRKKGSYRNMISVNNAADCITKKLTEEKYGPLDKNLNPAIFTTGNIPVLNDDVNNFYIDTHNMIYKELVKHGRNKYF